MKVITLSRLLALAVATVVAGSCSNESATRACNDEGVTDSASVGTILPKPRAPPFDPASFVPRAQAESRTRVEAVLARENIVDVKPALHIGAIAPRLRADGWFKGRPHKTGQGSILVVEFWATWCKPCLEAMPHLSELAERFAKSGVVVFAINVEDKPVDEVRAFVEKRGDMRYSVGYERGGDGQRSWITAAGLRGLPASFVVDRGGILAWVGHPRRLPEVVEQITSGRWNIESARATAARERLAVPYSKRVVEHLASDPPRGYALTRALLSSVLRDQPEYLQGLAYHILAAPNVAQRDLDLAYEVGATASALGGWRDPIGLETLSKIREAQSDWDSAIALQRRAAAVASNLPRFAKRLELLETAR